MQSAGRSTWFARKIHNSLPEYRKCTKTKNKEPPSLHFVQHARAREWALIAMSIATRVVTGRGTEREREFDQIATQ